MEHGIVATLTLLQSWYGCKTSCGSLLMLPSGLRGSPDFA